MNMYGSEKGLIRHKNDFIVTDNMIPVRQHQASDELMKLRREMGTIHRSQRDKEGRYP